MGVAAFAALGNMAGSVASSALFGEPAPVGPDTSIPGVTKAVLQPATKVNKELNAAQVDPTQSIDYFNKAAQAFEGKAMTGLGLYNAAIGKAIDAVSGTTQGARDALSGMILSGNAATDEYMKMLGMAPTSKVQSSGFMSQYQQSGSGVGGDQEILNLLNKNESLTDAAARQQGMQQYADLVNQRAGVLSSDQQAAIQAAAKAQIGEAPVLQKWKPYTAEELDNDNWREMQQSYRDRDHAELVRYNAAKAEYDSKLAAATDTLTADAIKQQQLAAEGNIQQYNTLYGQSNQQGYTNKQIQDKVMNDPGYQFQVDQGNQGIARAAAAGGMLGSGNALAEASKFNNGIANQYYNQYYNQYMGYLGGLMNAGNQASTNVSNIVANSGNNLAQLYGNIGSAALNTYQNIGSVYNSAYGSSGQMNYDAAKTNMAAQNYVLAQRRAQEADQQNQNTAAAAGLMNAGLAQSQFNYQVAQNQQGGQAYANSFGYV